MRSLPGITGYDSNRVRNTTHRQVSQTESGLVTLTPNGESAAEFSLDFGDGTSEEGISPGNSVNHQFAEGDFKSYLMPYNFNQNMYKFLWDSTKIVSEMKIPYVTDRESKSRL